MINRHKSSCLNDDAISSYRLRHQTRLDTPGRLWYWPEWLASRWIHPKSRYNEDLKKTSLTLQRQTMFRLSSVSRRRNILIFGHVNQTRDRYWSRVLSKTTFSCRQGPYTSRSSVTRH